MSDSKLETFTQGLFSHWRANFLAGLAIIMPAVISFAVLIWLFGTAARITDTLLFFLPRALTHQQDGTGPLYWYWSLAAFLLALFLICVIGLLARHYVGKRVIVFVETVLLRIPLLGKIYSTIKQVNDAFSSSKNTAFRTVVLIEYPRQGVYSLGFITSEQPQEMQAQTPEHTVCVFVPTTPNPTSGFLVLVPQSQVTPLNISVADGIKFIISLGSIVPDFKLGDLRRASRRELPDA